MVRTKDRLTTKRVVKQNSDDIVTTDANADANVNADAASHIESSPIPNVSSDATNRIDNDTVDATTTDGGKVESKKRKPLPAGYICRACGEVGIHAIYECPLKVPLKKLKTADTSAADTSIPSPAVVVVLEEEQEEATGTRDDDSTHHPVPKSIKSSNKDIIQQIKKATDGPGPSHPLSTKHVVFISGLPFSCKATEVIAVFQSEGIGSDLSRKDVRLVMFDDSPQRCKGLAYVTFHSEDDYKMALALTNRTMAGRTLLIEVCKPNRSAITAGNGNNHGDNGGGGGGAKQLEDRSKSGGRGSRNHDDHPASSSSSSSFGKKKISSSTSSSRCYRCGMQHDVNQCTNKRICYRCKSTEHLSNQCPMKKKSL